MPVSRIIQIVATCLLLLAGMAYVWHYASTARKNPESKNARYGASFILICIILLLPLVGFPKSWVLNPSFLITWSISIGINLVLALCFSTLGFLKIFQAKSFLRQRRQLIYSYALMAVFFILIGVTFYKRFPEVIPQRFGGGYSIENEFKASGYNTFDHPLSNALVQDYHSPHYAYSVILQGSHWTAWRNYYQEFPKAEFGASHPESAYIIIIPYLLVDGKSELKTFAEAALNEITIDPAELWKGQWKKETQGNFEGYVFDFEKRAEAAADMYQLKLMAGKNHGYLISAWARSGETSQALDLLEEIHARTVLKKALTRALTYKSHRKAFNPVEKVRHFDLYVRMADLFGKQGRFQKAKEYLSLAQELDPANVQLVEKLLQILLRLEDYKSASDLLQANAGLLANRGDVEAAIATLQSAQVNSNQANQTLTPFLKEAVDASSTETSLQEAAAQTSHGNQTDQTSVQNKDTTLTESSTAGVKVDVKQTEGVLYQIMTRGVHFDVGKPMILVDERNILITDRDRAEEFQLMSFPFHNVKHDIQVEHFSILNSNGEETSAGTPGKVIVNAKEMMMTGDYSTYVLQILLPELQTGDTIHCRVRIQDKIPRSKMGYIEYSFFSDGSYQDHQFYLETSDESKVSYNHEGPLELSQDARKLIWLLKPATESEPSSESSVPARVQMTDKAESWTQVARDYLSSMRAYTTASPETKAKAVSLLSGIDPMTERLNVIRSFILKNYQWTPGSFSSQPRGKDRLAVFNKKKKGDSVDIAFLFYRFLQVVNIPAIPVLINTEGPKIERTLPSLDQFETLALYLPEVSEGMWMDIGSLPFSIKSSLAEYAGKEALYLDVNEVKLVNLS